MKLPKNFPRSPNSWCKVHPLPSDEYELDDLVKVEHLVDVLYDVLNIYGYKEDAPLSFTRKDASLYKRLILADKERLFQSYYSYVKLVGFGSWKDLFKYKINSFFSYVMEQDCPVAPPSIENFKDLSDPSCLVYGRAKRFLRNFDRKKLVSFAQSIAQSKKGAPPVHSKKVYEAEVKTFEKLTSPPIQADDFQLEDDNDWFQPINKAVICMELRRTIREVFRDKKLSRDDVYKPFFPSTNSNYMFSRKKDGAVGAFYDTFPEYFPISRGESLIKKRIDEVDLSGRMVSSYGMMGEREGKEIEEEELEHGPETLRTLGLLYDDSEFQSVWNHFYDDLWLRAIIEDPLTKCLGLPEPLKVRVITAGPPLTYMALKPIQKWLWRSIKDIKVFELVGTPITGEFITEKIGKLGDENVFVSGDYVASTDNLHSWVSECLCIELIAILKENSEDISDIYLSELQELMLRALTGHIIIHPALNAALRMMGTGIEIDWDNLDKNIHFEAQTEGQLMGSIISFPFLCLANAALCRFALEISEKRTYKIIDGYLEGHESAPLGINGDDCVFQGHKDRIFGVWEKVTAFAGLSSSVGKTFVSSKFLTMNSVQYQYNNGIGGWEEFSGKENWSYEEQKYCNMALVYGQEKSGIREKNACTLGSLHRELLKTCPNEYWKLASDRFIKYHRQELDKYPDIPWFIPEWLGGRGLIPHRKKYIPCKFERTVAAKIRSLIGNGEESWRIPLSVKERQKWKMHQLVNKDNCDFKFLGNQPFKQITYDDTSRDLESEDGQFYKNCVIDLLFTKDRIQLSQCLKLDDHAHIAALEFHNGKVWRHQRQELLKVTGKFNPMIPEELCHEKLMSFLPTFNERC